MGSERRVGHRCHDQQPKQPAPPCPRAAVRGLEPASAGGRPGPASGAQMPRKNALAVVRTAREVVEGGLFFLDLSPRPSPTADVGVPRVAASLLGFDTARGRVRAVVGGEPTRAVCMEEDIAGGGLTSACARGRAASGNCRARATEECVTRASAPFCVARPYSRVPRPGAPSRSPVGARSPLRHGPQR